MKNSQLKALKLYPHFLITNEKFPRLLVTRKIENDNSEYFGAFLPKTGARLLLGFANKVFKLRSCEIEIDGDFLYPCPMFYRKKCLAPCVEKICDEKQYAENVELLRLFLGNQRAELKHLISKKIENYSDAFDFENAAMWRDFLLEIEKVWTNKRWNCWLGDAIDTWEISDNKEQLIINLVTQRGRKILGNRSFLFVKDENDTASEMLEKIFSHFYEAYIPKEIRVFEDFESRLTVAKNLSAKFGRNITIKIQKDLTSTTKKGFLQTKFDSIINKLSEKNNAKDIKRELKKVFKLKKMPERIEAFDVAHISGTNVVASKIVWDEDKLQPAQNEVWYFEDFGEPAAIMEAIRRRFEQKEPQPDLVLIDGGKTQINAALKGLENFQPRNFKVISAVKPKDKHNEVSHFLDEDLNKIELSGADSFYFLTNLRDISHNLANTIHAFIRDTDHFYELAKLLPNFSEKERRDILQKTGSLRNLEIVRFDQLEKIFDQETAAQIFANIAHNKNSGAEVIDKLIPIRFDAVSGNAEDLQPILNFNLTQKSSL